MELLVSFAEHKEDVIFAHALSDIDPSDIFWVDVGANDPVDISVTRLLYLRGGHGVNIEPQPKYKERYALLRERDINLSVAVGETEGTLTLYGSDGVASVLPEHAGGALRSISVEAITLNKVFKNYVPDGQDVHILKLDVEGFEREIIMGFDLSRYRPWIICTECTNESYKDYEPKILRSGYQFVYGDGISRFYVLEEHTDIMKKMNDAHRIDELYEIVYFPDTRMLQEYEQSKSWRITAPLRKAANTLRKIKMLYRSKMERGRRAK